MCKIILRMLIAYE